MGAINEKEMPFENNENKIALSEIQNKTVNSQVYDSIIFPSVSTESEKNQLKQQMKQHIKSYGAISANIHGAAIFSEYYNNKTGAMYSDNEQNCPVNHGVAIIGWDDNYAIENFNEAHRPTNQGAWIIKNSWGEKLEYTIEEMKLAIFQTYPEECAKKGWTAAYRIC